MLVPEEIEYLRHFAAKDYSGQGAIVDLGTWFGVSTVALVNGIREHPNPAHRSALVHAYDLFIWEAWMDDLRVVRGTPLEGKYKPGESFLEECRQLTEPWKDNIVLYPGDLSAIGWSGGPIEFLFVDAMKSWPLANSIIHDFYPALIPGVSVVVQQDFGSFYVYWLHLTTYRFRDYFAPIDDLPFASSVAFKYVRQIPESLLRSQYELSTFSNDEIDAAFEYTRSLVGSVKRAHLAAAKVRCYLERDDRVRADRAFFELAAAIDTQHGIERSERAEFARLDRENDRLRTELERLRALSALEQAQSAEGYSGRPGADEELQQLRTELRSAREALTISREDLGRARGRIAAMESSKFWKLRRAWFGIKRALHIPATD